MCAFERGVNLRVPRTGKRTVFQHHRRRQQLGRPFKFRDGDVDLGVFHEQFHVTQLHLLAGHQPRFRHGVAVHKRAVGGAAIAQDHAVVGQDQFAVMRGNGGMADEKVGVRVAPDAVHAKA